MSAKTLIIGAGPGGLAVAGRLRQRGMDFDMLEMSDRVASMWHLHYDRLCLHTVKQLSQLPHLDFPKDYPTYIPRQKLVDYFEAYAKKFAIQPQFGVEVVSIDPDGQGGWTVRARDGRLYEAANVVVATGVNRVPHEPTWPGQDLFAGTVVHSRLYKNPTPFTGKTLVIGMGNTGAEIALDLAEQGVETYLSVRSPVNIVPRDLHGRPTQLTARKLAKIPFGLGDWLGSVIRRWYIGDLRPFGIELSKMHPAVQLRETGKTPVIDLGTVDLIKAGKIKVLPDIQSFDETGVTGTDGQHHPIDHVILATGYTAELADFMTDLEGLLDRWRVPKSPIGTGRHRGLYFVGFDNYKLGGILGTIYTDSEAIVEAIATT